MCIVLARINGIKFLKLTHRGNSFLKHFSQGLHNTRRRRTHHHFCVAAMGQGYNNILDAMRFTFIHYSTQSKLTITAALP